MRNHRILSPTFVLARPVCLAIKLSFAFTLFVRFPTVLREPLSASVTFLGGDRPSQTVHLTVSQDQIHGLWLESQYYKGGIPRMTPHRLTSMLIVSHLSCTCSTETQCQATVKAPWGLSVLSQVTGIFTGITISPSLLLRQCPNRYAFRAGRNLPDKEFRYLRTVIVTAAVYWGLSSVLRLL